MLLHDSLSIRNAEQRDTEALSALAGQTYADAFGHTFSATDLAAHVRNHLSPSHIARIIAEDVVLLAEVGERLVGYVQCGALHPAAAARSDQELRRLYVHAAFQQQGYGTALLEAALRHPQMRDAATIYLDVWEHNPGAQRLYQRYGFAVIGTRTFDVESGADTSLDLIMVRRAAPANQ